jgi:hypothetical protein
MPGAMYHKADVSDLFLRAAVMLRKLFFSVLLLALNSTVFAASAHVTISAVGGKLQTVPIGQPLPQPFIAQVTFDDGSPVVGLNLAFSVNSCANVPELPPGSSSCPAPSAYGHFVTDAVATTDASGTAIAPAFVAGSAEGKYSVFATRANWSQVINGQTLTDIPASPPASNLFQIIQTTAGTPVPALPTAAIDPAPMLPLAAMFVLVGLLCLAAYFRLARV